MKHIYTIFLIALLLDGCTKKIYVPVVREHKITDTITRTQADSAIIEALFECDSLGRVRMRQLEAYKGVSASNDINFKEGALRVETRWRTQYIDRFVELRDTITVVDYCTKTVEVSHIPAFFWWTFAIALVALLYVIWRIIRKFK